MGRVFGQEQDAMSGRVKHYHKFIYLKELNYNSLENCLVNAANKTNSVHNNEQKSS